MNFFILGNPRSGTTLLRLMLNTHSKIGVPPECGMVLWWHDKYKDWKESLNKDVSKTRAFVNDILSSKKIEEWKLTEQDVQKVFKRNPKNVIEVFEFLYQNYTEKEIVGDKNNYFIKELDALSKIYSNSKFIHLVRDGRDVACSYLKIKELSQDLKYIPVLPDTMKTISEEWNQNIINIDSFLENKKALVLKYEDLISKPKESLTMLCNFLNVEFEEEMLNFSSHNNEPVSTLHWKKKTLEKIDAKNSFKYRTLLSQDQIEEFNKIAGPSLKKYKYEIKH